jgi:hypoxanthine-guanine phosphoribosyltransferase
MENLNSPVKNKHVLVVDDDIELALTYQALLQWKRRPKSAAGSCV